MSAPPTRRIAAIYSYSDERGAALYEVVRYEPKDFKQRVPDANAKGGYRWKLDDVRRVPYRLPELRLSIEREDMIFVVEGTMSTPLPSMCPASCKWPTLVRDIMKRRNPWRDSNSEISDE